MSIGAPSTLGTLLVQRLDAVLGTTLSQQANLVSGARPDAVSQPTDAESVEAARNELIRHPREAVDRSTAQVEQGARRTIDKPDVGARLRATNDAANTPDTSSTPSAPTRLGFAARTILALLAEFPDQAPPVTGKALLSNPAAAQPGGTTSSVASATANAPPTPPDNALSQSSSKTESITTQSAAGTAVTGHAVPTASALAKALANALQTSGLFYESHLTDLAFGKRLATALATEPQAQLGKPTQPGNQATQGQQNPNAASSAHTTQSGTTAAQQTNTAAPQHTAAHSGDNQSNNAQQQSAGTSATASATHAAQANANQLPAATHLLVRQQLEVLANQTFAWQGEAWPNAPLQWEVRRHEGPWPGDANNAQQHWATRIRINLPRLGTVDARLNLVNSQLLLQLSAPNCADTLESGSQTLRQRLGAAGLFVEQLAIDANMSASGAPDHEPVNE